MAIASSDKLVVVKAFAPSNPLPLDAREIHESLAEARAYAATSAIAYAGQTIKVVENGVVTVYTLAPSEAEGVNYELQFVGGGGSGIQNVGTSATAGNITITSVEGDKTVTKDVPVVGAFVDVTVAADGEKSEATTFTYKDAANADQTKVVYATGIRKVEAGTTGGKLKVTNAATDGVMTTSEIIIGAGSVMNPAYDADSRKITLPVMQADGTTQNLEIALGKDMVVTSGAYNEETHEIELTLTDGTVVKIPATELVDVYTGVSTATVLLTVSSDNKISAAVKLSPVEGNVLKSDENGLYVSEADFTETKQLIVDAESAAKAFATQEIGKAETAIGEDIDAAKTYAEEKAEEAKESAIAAAAQDAAQKVGDLNTTLTKAIGDAKDEAMAHAEDQASAAQAAAEATAAQALTNKAAELTTAIGEAEGRAKTYAEEQASAAQAGAEASAAQALTNKAAELTTAIGTAETNAKTYAEEQATAAQEAAVAAAQADAKSKADAAEAAAKTYAEEQAEAKASAAQEAAEATAAQALTNKAAELTTAIGTAETNAKTYAEEQAEEKATAAQTAAEATAKGYTDEAAAGLTEDIKDAKDEAMAHAEEQAAAAQAAAVAAAQADATSKANAAEAAAKTHAEEQATAAQEAAVAAAQADATSKANAAQEAAVNTAKSYTDGQVEDCLGAAKAYADQVGASAGVVTWVDFGA